MTYPLVRVARLGRMISLAFVVFAAVVGFLVLIVGSTPSLDAQSSQPTDAAWPSFENASIDANGSRSTNRLFRDSDPRQFRAVNVSVRTIIDYAYDSVPGINRVSGGPDWIDSERYDIDANVADATVHRITQLPREQQNEQMRLMLRSLLADRFKLQMSDDTEVVPAYALTIANDGPRMMPTENGANNALASINRPGEISAHAMSVATLARDLESRPEMSGCPVVDLTMIKGYHDFTLRYSPGKAASNGSETSRAAVGNNSQPLIFSALEEQLGLKLEATQGPVVRYKIEHIEKPNQN